MVSLYLSLSLSLLGYAYIYIHSAHGVMHSVLLAALLDAGQRRNVIINQIENPLCGHASVSA